MGKITLLLADDHPIVRMGLRKLLESEPDFVVVGEASNGQETLELVDELEPDLLLLDIEMPGMSGLEVARRLRAERSSVRVVALSGYLRKSYIQGMLELSAAGYIAKEDAPGSIHAALRAIANGAERWLSPRAREALGS